MEFNSPADMPDPTTDGPVSQSPLVSRARQYASAIRTSQEFEALPKALKDVNERTFEAALGVLTRIELKRQALLTDHTRSHADKAVRIKDVVTTESAALDYLESAWADDGAIMAEARRARGSDAPDALQVRHRVASLDHRKMLVGHVRRTIASLLQR